jgi:hypothetical protein
MDPTQQQNAMMVSMLANGGAQPQDPMATMSQQGSPQGMGAAPTDPVQAQAMADMYSQQMAQGQNSSLGNAQGTSLGLGNMYNAMMSPAPY